MEYILANDNFSSCSNLKEFFWRAGLATRVPFSKIFGRMGSGRRTPKLLLITSDGASMKSRWSSRNVECSMIC